MKDKRINKKEQGNTGCPSTALDRVQNMGLEVLNGQKSNHNFKFNPEKRKLHVPDEPRKASIIEIRREDMHVT